MRLYLESLVRILHIHGEHVNSPLRILHPLLPNLTEANFTMSSVNTILPSFFGALQASSVVILTIAYGALAARLNLLSKPTSKDISKASVAIFLPALLLTNLAAELHLNTVTRYVPVISTFPADLFEFSLISIVWAAVYTLLSCALSVFLEKSCGFPRWAAPAISFNNTTALPLLLVQALDTTGILGDLLIDENDSSAAAAGRAKSYFLVRLFDSVPTMY
jgi:hypothetical protein